MRQQSLEKLHLLYFKMDEIIEKCLRINQILDIHPTAFTLKNLRTKDWYLEVLNILFPYLADRFNLIAQSKSQGQAIDSILLLLTEEDFIEKDFLSIKGQAIVDGQEDCIFYLVELIEALLERTMEEAEETEGQESQRVQRGQKKEEGECHSVQAIRDQFEQDESEGEEILYKNAGNYQSYANAFSDNKSEESQDSHYLKQLQKCKSQEHLHQLQKCKSQEHLHQLHQNLGTTNFTKPKASHKINQNNSQNVKQANKGLRKIVVHPKLKKPKKPLTKKAKQFTNQLGQKVSKQISRIVLDKQEKQEKIELSQGIRTQIAKKNREYEFKVKEIQKERGLRLRRERYITKDPMESDAKLKSLLKWKEAKLQKAKRIEMSLIINKLQGQKERYVKTVNQLILKMERQKQIDEHREFQEQMSRAKRKARIRIAAMEQKFRDELDILRENKEKQKAEEKIIVAGHRDVVKQIQEELKREHKQKVTLLLRQCNQNQNQVNNDLQELTHKIVDAYKKK